MNPCFAKSLLPSTCTSSTHNILWQGAAQLHTLLLIFLSAMFHWIHSTHSFAIVFFPSWEILPQSFHNFPYPFRSEYQNAQYSRTVSYTENNAAAMSSLLNSWYPTWNHGMIWIRRDPRDHLIPTPCPCQGHLPQARLLQTPHAWSLRYLRQLQQPHNSPWAIGSPRFYPTGDKKTIFPHVDYLTALQFSSPVSLSRSFHNLQLIYLE